MNADGTDAKRSRPDRGGSGSRGGPRTEPGSPTRRRRAAARGCPAARSGRTRRRTGGPGLSRCERAEPPEAELWLRASDGSGEPIQITDAAGDDRSSAWSPDGERLVFDSTRDGNTELYVVNADGSNPVRLTDDPAEDWSASWSPDGRTIAFTSDRSGSAQIWTMAVDGSGATQLTDDRIGALWPSWSPDGTRITYTAWETGRQQVWSMAADGSDHQNLSRSDRTIDSVWDGSWGRTADPLHARRNGA